MVADEVVEALEVGGVTGDLDPRRSGETGQRVPVAEADAPVFALDLLALPVPLQVELRLRLLHEAVDRDRTDPVEAAGQLLIDPEGRGQREVPCLGGDPSGLPGREGQVLHTGPQMRQAVLEVQDVGKERHRRVGGDPESGAERLRGERGDPRRTVTAQGLRARHLGDQVVVPGRVAGLLRRRVQHAPVGSQLELDQLGPSDLALRHPRGRQHTLGVEVVDLERGTGLIHEQHENHATRRHRH
ncbi:MAG TPA: hypothetical protein PLP61_00170 [Nocardioides sp.]|uniref:hypothetical protein n=1 Tax=Nocardioides sp. TaxID=35761 RepID=UPI002CCA1A67|nr:hypothetical protein [Nocardioides sp.]HQR25427.1 hypothetical protein [Nocardioides sp.]